MIDLYVFILIVAALLALGLLVVTAIIVGIISMMVGLVEWIIQKHREKLMENEND